MKIAVTNYTFSAATREVTFNDYVSISLEGVLLINNATTNTIIYQFNDNTLGGSVSGNILTLTYDTSTMSDTDALLIYYDDPAASQSVDTGLVIPTDYAVETGGNLDTIVTNTGDIDTDLKSGAQKTQVTDGSGTAVAIKDLTTAVTGTDLGLVTQAVIHGKSTAGGGTYVDVKVNPSGAVSADVTGAVTANAGTNLNTSALALETGGNLASVKTNTDTLAGAVSSSKVNVNIASGNPTSITANAGTNLNTSALALETGGNLSSIKTNSDTLAGAISSSKMNVNISSGNITGFATSTAQTDGSQKTKIVDGSGNTIGATSNALDINIKSGNPTTMAVTQTTSPWRVAALDVSRVSSNATPITATTTSVIAAPSAGNHLEVCRIHMSNGGATPTWVAIRDGAAGTQHYRTYLPQGGTLSLNLNISGRLKLTTATRLDIVLSAAGSVEYTLDYIVVAD